MMLPDNRVKMIPELSDILSPFGGQKRLRHSAQEAQLGGRGQSSLAPGRTLELVKGNCTEKDELSGSRASRNYSARLRATRGPHDSPIQYAARRASSS